MKGDIDRRVLNVCIGRLMGIEAVTVDLPTGYAGRDYIKNPRALKESLDEAYKYICAKMWDAPNGWWSPEEDYDN